MRGCFGVNVIGFEDWRKRAAAPAFTEWLRETAEPVWTRVVRHRFAEALIGGSLPDEVMARYLVQDYRFLDRLVALLGAMIACADRYESRIPLCRFAAAVTGEENTYFQRAFEALGVPKGNRRAPPEAEVTRALGALLDETIASGVYPYCLSVLCAAEWSYLSWAERADGRVPPRFVHAEWITLHDNPAFRAFVSWLRSELDRTGAALDAAGQARCRALFHRTVELEEQFFDAAYG